MKMYGTELGDKAGHWLCTKCKTWNKDYGNATKKTVTCPWCSNPKPDTVVKEKAPVVINESTIGGSADNPIPLFDRDLIMKALERGFSDVGYFLNSEQVIKTNDGREVRAIGLKLDTGVFKTIFFGEKRS